MMQRTWKQGPTRIALAMAAISLTAMTASAQSGLHLGQSARAEAAILPANAANFAEAARAANPFLGTSSASLATASTSSNVELPEAPSTVLQNEQLQAGVPPAAAARDTKRSGPYAPPYTKYIPAGYVTSRQTVKEKELTGAKDLYSFGNFAAMFLSAGWEQVTNGSPNYGTDKGAFGQRLGAAAIRETSQGLFTDMVFSPLLHQDLRYYVKGPRYGVIHRSFYAASRVLISRTDSGHGTLNTALLAGYAATSAIEPLYYPKINRNWDDMLSGYGGSLGGAMLGNLFSEFQDDLMEIVHLKKKP
jgi:hypothetical protein